MALIVHITREGVPVDIRVSHPELDRAIAYENHRSARDHPDGVWKKQKDDVRRDRARIFNLNDARTFRGLRLSPLRSIAPKRVRKPTTTRFAPARSVGQITQ